MAKIFFIGDIVGRPGRQALQSQLSRICEEHAIDIVVANGENSAAGAGITTAIANELKGYGVDAITLGDHCWDQRGFDREIEAIDFLCRPANLPVQCPGRTHVIVEKNGFRLGVFTLLGNQFMKIRSNDAFAEAMRMIGGLRGQVDGVLVEFHAETTSEKIAMGWYLDGQVSAVIGTHTHVPTADATILPRGTAYITDVGMTGPYEGVLGRKVQPILAKFLDGMPRRFEIAEGDVRLCGLIFEVEGKGGGAKSVLPVQEKVEAL